MKFPIPSYTKVAGTDFYRHVGDYTGPGVFVRCTDRALYQRTESPLPAATRRLRTEAERLHAAKLAVLEAQSRDVPEPPTTEAHIAATNRQNALRGWGA